MTVEEKDEEKEDALYGATFVFGGMIFCDACRREANPQAPIFTDAEYRAQADKMRIEGWTSQDGLTVLCPACSRGPR